MALLKVELSSIYYSVLKDRTATAVGLHSPLLQLQGIKSSENELMIKPDLAHPRKLLIKLY